MPSREEFLNSYVRGPMPPGRPPFASRDIQFEVPNMEAEPSNIRTDLFDENTFADADSISESRANNRSAPQSASPDIDFKTLASSAQAFAGNPLQAKENVLSEVIGRLDREPANELNRSQATQISSDVLLAAVADRFGLGDSTRGTYFLQNRSPWRWASNFESTHAAQNALSGKKNIGQEIKNKIGNTVSDTFEKIRYPDFIANPLALRNPVVKPDSGVDAGSFLNARAANFINNFTGKEETHGPVSHIDYKSPFGSSVRVAAKPGDFNAIEHSLSFEGPFGYASKKLILKNLKEKEKRVSQSSEPLPDTLREIEEIKSKLNEPLTSPSANYMVGAALENVPIGDVLTAQPLEGARGARARWYAETSNNALITGKPFQTNLNQMPSDEEFRNSWERPENTQGGRIRPNVGYTFYQRELYNMQNAHQIRSKKLGPTTWLNSKGEQKEFDPGTLKDPMIRAIYNFPETQDVSSLRNNPLRLIEKTRNVDFTRPVITTDSLRYKLRSGLNSSLSVNAVDLIPSRETIQDFYAGKPVQGLKRMAGDFASGIPTALATGAAVTAAPALAPFAPGVVSGLALVRGANALDEVSRQQTGEGLVSKFRQTIGTAPRTGYANPDFKLAVRTTTPQVTALSPQQRKTMEQRQNRNELQKRIDLLKERFNPSRGEFGFSELIFGR